MGFVYYCTFLLCFFLSQIFGHTPLTEAVTNGHTDIAKLLIQNGADVNKEVGVCWKHKSYMLSQSISIEPELKNHL